MNRKADPAQRFVRIKLRPKCRDNYGQHEKEITDSQIAWFHAVILQFVRRTQVFRGVLSRGSREAFGELGGLFSHNHSGLRYSELRFTEFVGEFNMIAIFFLS
jgi:hypothetical protein